jgi:outer membrane protein assembly factor BamB
MGSRYVRLLTIALIALPLVLSGCTSDWATWGNGADRRGENPSESVISPDNVPSLTQKWAVDLGGAINAAPILVHDVDVRGTPTDLLYTGTEDGTVYAVSTNGTIVWSRDVGSVLLGCFFPNGIHGVSASVVFDRARNRVYTVGGDGNVYALDASTGSVADGWPIRLTSAPSREMVWGAPTLVGNHLYYEVASHCDRRPYRGRIVDIDPRTHTIVHTFYVSADGADGGGIWGWGGASVDTATGDVYIGSGNSFDTPENAPYADSVVRLSSSLEVESYDTPVLGISDDDIGSTPVLFQKSGCPAQLAVMQKNGSLYLYDRDSLASGPRQRVAYGAPPLIGNVAYSNATQMLYAVNNHDSTNGKYVQGVTGFSFDANCELQLAWQTSLPVSGATAPIVANGVVYAAGGTANKVYALRATDGRLLWDSATTLVARVVAEPLVFDGRLYAVAWDGKLHAWGL